MLQTLAALERPGSFSLPLPFAPRYPSSVRPRGETALPQTRGTRAFRTHPTRVLHRTCAVVGTLAASHSRLHLPPASPSCQRHNGSGRPIPTLSPQPPSTSQVYGASYRTPVPYRLMPQDVV